MVKKIFFYSFLLLCTSMMSKVAMSQEWRSVQLQDSIFFQIEDEVAVPNDSSDIDRMIYYWVDSVKKSGTDSLFYFNKTVIPDFRRLTIMLDYPSILGYQMRRNSAGLEKYYIRDTVSTNTDSFLIYTKAPVGFSWIMTGNSGGLNLKGTVDSIYFDNILADSVKVIKLEVYNNGVLQNEFYTNKKLLLSKNHGFQNLISINEFPRAFTGAYIRAEVLPPSSFVAGIRTNPYVTHIDWHQNINYKYQPGNSWQRLLMGYPMEYNYYCEECTMYILDSVLSLQINTPDTSAVVFHRIHFIDSSDSPPLVIDTAYTDTTAVSDTTLYTFHDFKIYPDAAVYYDASISAGGLNPDIKKNFIFMGTDTIPLIGIQETITGLDNHINQKVVYKTGFDTILFNRYFLVFGDIWHLYHEVIYYEIGNETYGTKVVFPSDTTIAIKGVKVGSPINIYPNPSSRQSPIHLSINSGDVQAVLLYDMLGRKSDIPVEKRDKGEYIISVSPDQAPGSYIIEAITSTNKYIGQLNIE